MLSGEAVVLHDGSLAQAVRASMAIPGVFTPVEIDGRVLADGGMVQNIPVETVLKMDADAVIAVELRLPPGDRNQLDTLAGVLTRAVDVMITQNERRSLVLAKAKVSVDMNGFSATDYSRVKELIRLGYKTAASQSDGSAALRDSGSCGVAAISRGPRGAQTHPPEKVETVVVTGADSDTNARLAARARQGDAGTARSLQSSTLN